jgi:hypothetical protein
VSTTLLTVMTGISLHIQWPLTSQLQGSVSQREQLFFVTEQTPRPFPSRSLSAQLWHPYTECSTVWVSSKPLITEENWPCWGLNPGLPNDTLALYPLLHKFVLNMIIIFIQREKCWAGILLVNKRPLPFSRSSPLTSWWTRKVWLEKGGGWGGEAFGVAHPKNVRRNLFCFGTIRPFHSKHFRREFFEHLSAEKLTKNNYAWCTYQAKLFFYLCT